MKINYADIVVGLGLAVTGIVLLRHFRKRTEPSQGWRLMCLAIMILGLMLAMWEPMFSLARMDR